MDSNTINLQSTTGQITVVPCPDCANTMWTCYCQRCGGLRWVTKPDPSNELADTEPVDLEVNLSLEEALDEVNRITAGIKAREQAARRAEAEYWRKFFNEDRIEELETAICDALVIASEDRLVPVDVQRLRRVLRAALSKGEAES